MKCLRVSLETKSLETFDSMEVEVTIAWSQISNKDRATSDRNMGSNDEARQRISHTAIGARRLAGGKRFGLINLNWV